MKGGTRVHGRDGRKTLLTEELIQQAEDLLKLGHLNKTVYKALGISKETWYKWIRDAEKLEQEDPFYREVRLKNASERQQRMEDLLLHFLHTIKRADSTGHNELFQCIRKAGKRSWPAAAWILERKYPELYSKAGIDVQVQQHLEQLAKEEAEAKLERETALEEEESNLRILRVVKGKGIN